MHLVDHARAAYRADLPPPARRAAGCAAMLALVLPTARTVPPRPRRGPARQAAGAAAAGRGCGRCWRWRRVRFRRRRPSIRPQVFPARGRAPEAGRAAARGCAQTGRRAGDQRGDDPAAHGDMASRWWWPPGAGCCGALAHHMGEARRRALAARRNHRGLERARLDGAGFDAIIVNASGCGTTIKDYGFMFRARSAYASGARRARVGLARDITRVPERDRPARRRSRHRPHDRLSFRLLHAARPEIHGAAKGAAGGGRLHGARRAGGASLLRLGRHLQSAAAGARRSACATASSRNIAATRPDAVATGNIGCISPARARGAPCRSCTPSSCSTGPPAVPRPAKLNANV